MLASLLRVITGFLHSTGEFVVFLDHDDRLMPGALKSNLQCMLAEPDCAFSFGDLQTINFAGAPLTETGQPTYMKALQDNLWFFENYWALR
jgi:hypothetical protein